MRSGDLKRHVEYYVIEFHYDDVKDWRDIDASYILFRNMTNSDKRGAKANRYRELLVPCSASSELWQQYGIHGFEVLDDAAAVLTALRVEDPDTRYRIVRRSSSRQTTVVSPHTMRIGDVQHCDCDMCSAVVQHWIVGPSCDDWSYVVQCVDCLHTTTVAVGEEMRAQMMHDFGVKTYARSH